MTAKIFNDKGHLESKDRKNQNSIKTNNQNYPSLDHHPLTVVRQFKYSPHGVNSLPQFWSKPKEGWLGYSINRPNQAKITNRKPGTIMIANLCLL